MKKQVRLLYTTEMSDISLNGLLNEVRSVLDRVIEQEYDQTGFRKTIYDTDTAIDKLYSVKSTTPNGTTSTSINITTEPTEEEDNEETK